MANESSAADHLRTMVPSAAAVDPDKVYVRARTGEIFVGRKVPARSKKPVVYFVQAENGLIKIGSTKYLKDRFELLCNGSPIPLLLLATVEGDRKTEYVFHARFAEHRQHGEWFLPHADILDEIERINGRK